MSARASFIIPTILIAVLVGAFLMFRPFDGLTTGTPPAEALTVESVQLDTDGIHITVRAAGAEAMTIAQVQIDGAYWQFTKTPTTPIPYLGTADIDIPYTWVAGDTHELAFVTSSGTTFSHTIDVARATPGKSPGDVLKLALIGLFVGFVPILIGYAFYPALMSFGAPGRQFAMALTVGLLGFLLVDTLSEGLEVAAKASDGFKANIAVWVVAAATCLLLLAVGRRDGKVPEGASLAMFIAIGIGMHNLGEGLAIGASLAIGEVALASFLVLGFFLHNVTEGIAISAPLRKESFSPKRLVMLALIAGAPAVPGTILGAWAVAPIWTAMAFAIGAGAILQVIIEVGGLMLRSGQESQFDWLSTPAISGFAGGIAIMYVTALMVHG